MKRAALSDLDIYRAAQALVRQHGIAASLEAAMMADEMVARGDPSGRNVWLRILRAVDELQRDTPLADESLQ